MKIYRFTRDCVCVSLFAAVVCGWRWFRPLQGAAPRPGAGVPPAARWLLQWNAAGERHQLLSGSQSADEYRWVSQSEEEDILRRRRLLAGYVVSICLSDSFWVLGSSGLRRDYATLRRPSSRPSICPSVHTSIETDYNSQ